MVLDVFIMTYNRSHYLKDSIESILNQTYTDFQLTILDNCSTDNTEEVVKSFDDNRIKYIKNEENIGAWGNINKAFSLADKKYFIVNHDDDIMMPDYLEKAIDFMEKNESVSVLSLGMGQIGNADCYSQCKFEKREKNIFNEVSFFSNGAFFKKYLNDMQMLSFPALIYRRSFMQEKNIKINSEAGPCADVLLMMEIERYGGLLAEIKENYIFYRIHEEQWSNIERTEMFVELFDYLYKDFYYAKKLKEHRRAKDKYFIILLKTEFFRFIRGRNSAEEMKNILTQCKKAIRISKILDCITCSIIKICVSCPNLIKEFYSVAKKIKKQLIN